MSELPLNIRNFVIDLWEKKDIEVITDPSDILLIDTNPQSHDDMLEKAERIRNKVFLYNYSAQRDKVIVLIEENAFAFGFVLAMRDYLSGEMKVIVHRNSYGIVISER